MSDLINYDAWKLASPYEQETETYEEHMLELEQEAIRAAETLTKEFAGQFGIPRALLVEIEDELISLVMDREENL
jgi:hypothetical protein